ncbi:MAG: c-type cytochrome [Trueperaceae bacterium]
MSEKHHGNPVATYIITALILGVITYFEFAIVEFEISWLSRAATLFWLVALSVVKFIMVVAIFMHLKDDERTYTGFFGSGMLIALATFVILPILFTVGSIPQNVEARAEAEEHTEVAEGGLAEETSNLIESDGYSRSADQLLDTPRPMDRSLVVEPPAAAEPEAVLSQSGGEAVPAEQDAEGAAADDGAVPEGAQAQQAPAEEPAEQPAQEQPAQAGAVEFDRELGESIYASNCQACHQADGSGLPGIFPPLAGNLPDLYNAEGGRDYLVDVVLYGLTGPIEVNGQTYNGAMPAWPQLSDEQIAAVLNHALTSWGNEDELEEFSPIDAGEVAAQRSEDPGDLNERRAQLQAQ